MNNIICKLKKKKIEKQQWPIKEEWESIKIVMKNICEEIKYDIPNLPKEIDQYNIGQIKKEVKEIHKIIYTKCQYEEDRWRNEQRKHRKNVLDRILNNKNGTQELLLDPEKIKREVITHFQNITGDKHKNIDLPERWEAQYKPKTEINKNWYDNIMKEPSFEEWKMIIKQLPNDKACGPSQINNEMIKHAVNKVQKIMWRLICFCMKIGDIPNQWREANVYPIPKQKEWECQIDNTRPITLLETLRKVLVKIITDRLSRIFARYDILKGNNFAGVPRGSTFEPKIDIGRCQRK
ncbi:1420_t:CDS:2 [Entrophospora sp. SA101]|nr:1420_t:CDS:2 [Entrophospora sp. SA101]